MNGRSSGVRSREIKGTVILSAGAREDEGSAGDSLTSQPPAMSRRRHLPRVSWRGSVVPNPLRWPHRGLNLGIWGAAQRWKPAHFWPLSTQICSLRREARRLHYKSGKWESREPARTMVGPSRALSLLIAIACCLSSWAMNVTYDGRAIIIDGQRRVLISGSIHYARSTAEVGHRSTFYLQWHCRNPYRLWF